MANNYGIKASKANQDVGTAGDSGLQFTSKYPLFKVGTQGSITMAPGTQTIAHGLSYVPAFTVTVYGTAITTGSDDRYYCGYSNQSGQDVIAYADATNLYIATPTASFGTITAYYYVFIDPGT